MSDLPIGWSRVVGVLVSPAQRAFFAAGLQQGMSATRIIASLRGTDLAIRREAGLALVRELTGAERAGRRYDAVRMDKRISDAAHQSSSRAMRERYSYWGRVDAINPQTGQRTELFANFSTNERLSRGEIVSRLTDICQAASEIYGYQLGRTTIRAALVRPEED